jgi:hypothetical protein
MVLEQSTETLYINNLQNWDIEGNGGGSCFLNFSQGEGLKSSPGEGHVICNC